MSVYEPKLVFQQILRTVSSEERAKFKTDWEKHVSARVKSWTTAREKADQAVFTPQLIWQSEVVEYVSYIHKKTSVNKKSTSKMPPALSADIAYLGPRFIPPDYRVHYLRRSAVNMTPDTAYTKALNIIHPVYYPEILTECPRCGAGTDSLSSNGWSGQGPREVHGLFREEMAFGIQLQCSTCKINKTDAGYCYATTSADYWETKEHWTVPSSIPHFENRCALTRELYDFIIEMRPSTTSGGLAEHIKQLHLFTYHRQRLALVRFHGLLRAQGVLGLPKLSDFSASDDATGYADSSISDDLVGDIFISFHKQTRREESDEYTRTRTGKIINFDTTFRVAKKASIVVQKTHDTPFKGGLLDGLNERSEVIFWRFNQTGQFSEITEVLNGLKTRHDSLTVPYPAEAILDNCCQMKSSVTPVFPDIHAGLDVHHLVARYGGVVTNKTANPCNKMILSEVSSAILETRAKDSDTGRAVYRSQADQLERLEKTFRKWEQSGNWTAAAKTVHAEQMNHVRKGCLTRSDATMRADGSRIELLHRHLNRLQHGMAGSLEMMFALISNFMLTWNIRVLERSPLPNHDICFAFAQHLFGSHHIRLVSHIATLINRLPASATTVAHLPLGVLPVVSSGESFGLAPSQTTLIFGGLLVLKEEEWDDMLASWEEDDIVEMTDSNTAPQVRVAEVSDTTMNIDSPEYSELSIAVAAPSTVASGASREVSEWSGTQHASASTCGILENKRKRSTGDDITVQVANQEMTAKKIRLEVKSSAAMNVKNIAPIFKSRTGQSATSASTSPLTAPAIHSTTKASTTGTIETLIQPLPQRDRQTMTPSERLLFASTGVHATSLVINSDGEEWFLFLSLRKECQWFHKDMTPAKWAKATSLYNERLAQRLPSAHPKLPRALSDQLSTLEQTIQRRLMTQNFKAHSSGKEDFWRTHCHAVSKLVEATTAQSEPKQAKKYAVQTCHRCNRLKYPKPTDQVSYGSHPKETCSDSVKSIARHILFPQPTGVFIHHASAKRVGETVPARMEFDPLAFIAALRVACAQDTDTALSAESYSVLSLFAEQKEEIAGDMFLKLSFLPDNSFITPNLPDMLFRSNLECGTRKITHLRLHCLDSPR